MFISNAPTSIVCQIPINVRIKIVDVICNVSDTSKPLIMWCHWTCRSSKPYQRVFTSRKFRARSHQTGCPSLVSARKWFLASFLSQITKSPQLEAPIGRIFVGELFVCLNDEYEKEEKPQRNPIMTPRQPTVVSFLSPPLCYFYLFFNLRCYLSAGLGRVSLRYVEIAAGKFWLFFLEILPSERK